ncbi:MAG: hypothetical protein KDB26_11915 [Microthrixaceae bacterium]|nr:hypothetical protein [Microthrixaceae bacterium]
MSLFAPDPAAVLAERRRILREVVLRGGMKPPANPDRVYEQALTDLDRDALAWEDNNDILRPHVDADPDDEHDVLVAARAILFELESALDRSLPMDTLIAKAQKLRIPPDTMKAAVRWLREADLCKLNSGVLRDVTGDKGRKNRVQLGDDLFTLRRPMPAPAPAPKPAPAPAPRRDTYDAAVSKPASAPAPAWTRVTPPPTPTPDKPVPPSPAVTVPEPEPVTPAYAADVPKTEPPKPAPVSRPAPAPETFPFDLNEIGEELRGIRAALELPLAAARTPAKFSPAIDTARRIAILLHALGSLTKVVLDNRLSRAQRKQLDAALELLVRRDAVVLTGSVLRGGTYTLVNPTPVGLSWELLDHAASKVKGHRREFASARGT